MKRITTTICTFSSRTPAVLISYKYSFIGMTARQSHKKCKTGNTTVKSELNRSSSSSSRFSRFGIYVVQGIKLFSNHTEACNVAFILCISRSVYGCQPALETKHNGKSINGYTLCMRLQFSEHGHRD